MAQCLLIEDRTTLLRAMVDSLSRQGVSDDLRYLDHKGALLPGYAPLLRSADVVLIDCKDVGGQQEDRTASQLACLDVLDRLVELGVDADVVAYSTDMHRPEVNIPVREYDIVRRAFTVSDLLVNLQELVRGVCPQPGVPRPTDEDFAALQVGPLARIATAHQQMRADPEAWELVWNPRHPVASRALRSRIDRRVGRHLDSEPQSVRHTVSVLRVVAGLPV